MNDVLAFFTRFLFPQKKVNELLGNNNVNLTAIRVLRSEFTTMRITEH